MPEPPTEEQFLSIIREDDAFRVTIRGFSAIEARIDKAMRNVFRGHPPASLRELGGFRTRLSLAVALGVIPRELRPPIEGLARLRNDFAHGSIDELPEERVRAIRRSFASVFPEEDAQLEGVPSLGALRMMLRGAWVAIGVFADAERRRREEEERGVAVRRAIEARLRELRAVEADGAARETGEP